MDHLHNITAPTYWDDEDWESSPSSDDEASLTDGEEDLRFLVHGELEPESDDDRFSWDSADELLTWQPSAGETEDEVSSEETTPPAKRIRWGSSSDDDDEDDEEPPVDSSGDEEDAGSSADGSGGDDEDAGSSADGSGGDDEDGDGDDEAGF